ncbi:MAG TPA: prolipoprotein diacylglyceryl transferase [Stellaceae bacterium]|nr:prolipoprotein diacylglyceryl transferase [Stellaceae bacterium]
MPLYLIPFPAINPVALALGPFEVRWYALAYIVGLLIGWRYCLRLADRPPRLVARNDIDDFLVWATLGVVLGGRIGYVLFYNLPYYADHPIEALYLWHGGMSFHGGALGVTVAIWLFSRRRSLRIFALSDIIIEAVPIGLFFGRIANFINGELYGRPADVPWAMKFPLELLAYPQKAGAALAAVTKIDPRLNTVEAIIAAYGGDPKIRAIVDRFLTPRHPSQIYEALCEGALLFLLLFFAERAGWRRRPGMLSGLFLCGYAVARMSGELFRQPDEQLGYLFHIGQFGVTMGQLLSIPVLIAGIVIIYWVRQAPEPVGAGG